MGGHRIVKKKMPSSDEIVQHFVDSRHNPFMTKSKKMIYGDVFYSDISHYIHNVLGMKHSQATKTFMAVCDGLRAKNYWVHS